MARILRLVLRNLVAVRVRSVRAESLGTSSWEGGAAEMIDPHLQPPDPAEATFHCKICCREQRSEFSAGFLGRLDEADVDCDRCGRRALPGELDYGVCELCGVQRTLEQVALGGWHIEQQDDMVCGKCMEAHNV